MSFWAFLNHWWNLPWLVMLGLVGVFFALQLAGLAGHASDSDADHDADLDHDAQAHGGSAHGSASHAGVPYEP